MYNSGRVIVMLVSHKVTSELTFSLNLAKLKVETNQLNFFRLVYESNGVRLNYSGMNSDLMTTLSTKFEGLT